MDDIHVLCEAWAPRQYVVPPPPLRLLRPRGQAEGDASLPRKARAAAKGWQEPFRDGQGERAAQEVGWEIVVSIAIVCDRKLLQLTTNTSPLSPLCLLHVPNRGRPEHDHPRRPPRPDHVDLCAEVRSAPRSLLGGSRAPTPPIPATAATAAPFKPSVAAPPPPPRSGPEKVVANAKPRATYRP